MHFADSLKQERQQAGSSAAHAAETVIPVENVQAGDGDPEDGINLQFKHAGRQVIFSEETIEAAKAEFKRRVTGPKRGMAAEAMVEMLIRLRQCTPEASSPAF